MAEYRTLGLRLMIICLVAALALAGVNALTEPVIKAREEAALEGVGTLAAGDYTGTARGFGGDVVVEFTVGDDGTITAISASGDGETAGVGTLAFEESYLNNFIGASFPVTVDTLAGATYTSSAIIDALNAAASGGSGSGGGSGAARASAARSPPPSPSTPTAPSLRSRPWATPRPPASAPWRWKRTTLRSSSA